ncbi:DUF2752 domain-containing protein [Paludibacter sp. 221]|uniref:DUF2752 domain-containing protein n=1 Tax=Paludibacter sp. 221 TaxID=2302939 RepID=UPI0013D771EA|nr:DUF2752 domain-containing protein [Paludibacter sp. 221]NDV46417.1 DUF2752 domain-containing protein [Paludibacter sp. 221]
MHIALSRHTKAYKRIKLTVFLVFPFLLYLIPVDWLNQQPTICLYKNIFGHECFGCGITRAILSAMHFDFHTAFGYNKLVVIVLPLLIYAWAQRTIKLWKEVKTVNS